MPNTFINLNNVWKQVTSWINVNNTWKQCTPWINVNGVWKKCGAASGGISTMTVYIPSSGDSSSQSQSRIVSINSLQSVISCTVNTGSVSYSVSGTNVTINVDNGTSVRSYTPPPLTKTDIMQTEPGGAPTSLPSFLYYNSDGYSGTLTGGTAYVYSGSPAGTKYCTGTWGGTLHVVNGNLDSSDPLVPNSISYNDVDGYSGDIDFISVNASYQANYNAFLDAIINSTSWSGYILFDYGATLSKPDTRVWRKDYSGTVYGATINYYAYTVTLGYVN